MEIRTRHGKFQSSQCTFATLFQLPLLRTITNTTSPSTSRLLRRLLVGCLIKAHPCGPTVLISWYPLSAVQRMWWMCGRSKLDPKLFVRHAPSPFLPFGPIRFDGTDDNFLIWCGSATRQHGSMLSNCSLGAFEIMAMAYPCRPRVVPALVL